MTTPHLYDEKDVMEEFISCYRHFTALWDNRSMDYLSKRKKAPGYQQLLKILRRVNPEASVQDAKRKINSLRCCYRREIKKIQNSYDGYEPRLWWFHRMDFLKPVLNLDQTATTTPTTPMAKVVTTYTRIKQSLLDDSLDETSMHDEDIFAEPYQPGEDMLVMEGEGDNEVDGDADVDNESIVDGDGDGDGDGVGVVMAEQEEQEHATLNETRHKSDIKMESKYQPQQQHSSNNSINNNNSSARHTRIHPYGIAQTRQHQQQQQQQQYHHRQQQHQQQQQHQRRINALQQMRRRRQSSTNDADVDGDSYVDIDIDEERSIAAGKKRRRQQQQMMSSSSSLEQQHTEQTESECDLIGKRMAAHFRNMRPDQRLFAERIISEVLVFGRMNRLSLSARFLPNGGGGGGGVGDVYARVDGK